jgi:hypothetical protein
MPHAPARRLANSEQGICAGRAGSIRSAMQGRNEMIDQKEKPRRNLKTAAAIRASAADGGSRDIEAHSHLRHLK